MSRALIRSASAWAWGRWLEPGACLDAEHQAPTEPSLPSETLASTRIARADRATRLAAAVVARALRELEPVAPERLAVASASVLASAETNESFERRRISTGKPEPRVFPYTAPNAAAGEIAIAVQARGPFVSLVGTAEVSAAALERACRWLENGDADRVIVLAVECPSPSVHLVCPTGTSPLECAAAVVLEPLGAHGSASVQVRWAGSDDGAPDRFVVRGLTLLSVEALARVALAHHGCAPLGLRVDAPGGACLLIDVLAG